MIHGVRRAGSESLMGRGLLIAVPMVLGAILSGCQTGPTLLKPEQQALIDRKVIEYPAGTELRLFIQGLTAPTAMTWDTGGSLLIVENGTGGREPRILGFKADGTTFEVYPHKVRLPLHIGTIIGQDNFRLYGPIGGLVAGHGRIYVSHRDEKDRGVITAFDYDGTHKTIVADIPAEGDHAITDMAISPNGRLYFGVGSVTNSGVVGVDNAVWVKERRENCDKPWGGLYLLGRRFDTPNPFSGWFSGPNIAVTAPFQPFGTSIETHIPAAANSKPTGAIYSVDGNGGDLRVEAHGLRYPMGLAFSEAGVLYITNQGMKMRGTRPVKDDPDVMLRLVHGQWYGWPDYSANLLPIRDARFQPPVEMMVKSGYRDLSFLIDHEASGLAAPNPNSGLLMAEFKPLVGAAKFDLAPGSGPLSRLRQAGNVAIVALMGDRAPFDTGGQKMVGPGYKLVQVNLDERQVRDFVRNTLEGPASQRDDAVGLERPIDVKFGPDGAMYILDLGRMEMERGREIVRGGTGRVFKLVGVTEKK